MFRILQSMRVVSRNIKTSAMHWNDCKDTETQETIHRIKSEKEIQEIISVKMKQYEELVLIESPESAEIIKEVTVLDSKLRKSFGFSQDEDLTQFPVIKFDEREIDNQLD